MSVMYTTMRILTRRGHYESLSVSRGKEELFKESESYQRMGKFSKPFKVSKRSCKRKRMSKLLERVQNERDTESEPTESPGAMPHKRARFAQHRRQCHTMRVVSMKLQHLRSLLVTWVTTPADN
jgi:hypothetical protein